MIKCFEAENYYCLKSVALDLQPIHALIGPNDSGKSSLLRAMRAVADVVDPRNADPPPRGAVLTARASDRWFRLTGTDARPTLEHSGLQGQAPDLLSRGAALIKWDAEQLKQPSGLVPESIALRFGSDHGSGFPGVLQSIQGRGDESFAQLRDALVEKFPTLRSLGIAAVNQSMLALRAQLRDGTVVPAAQISEGLLYYAAYLTLQHLRPVSLLLVEEPENGLHPSRIRDVVCVLRTLAEKGTQVVIATHSPLVINELRPEEVTLVTRASEARGTVLTPMTKTKDFERRSKTYALGELWLSYADGSNESELVP